jgi:hypothetical protein
MMIGFFAPAVTVAMMSLVLGSANVPKMLVRVLFGGSIFMAILFVFVNMKAIGGSEVIFMFGNWPAYDGVWFHGDGSNSSTLMPILFILRLIDPVFLVFGAGTLVLWHAYIYPIEKKMLYDNMPRQQFVTKLQAKVRGKIIASRSLSAFRKDVTGYLYGGDITRKMKLLEKQKKGKKKALELGKNRVNIPQDVFMKMVKSD